MDLRRKAPSRLWKVLVVLSANLAPLLMRPLGPACNLVARTSLQIECLSVSVKSLPWKPLFSLAVPLACVSYIKEVQRALLSALPLPVCTLKADPQLSLVSSAFLKLPFLKIKAGVPVVAQQKQIWLVSMEDASLISGFTQWVKDRALLWLAAAALIQPQAWEPPYAGSAALKRWEKKKKI